MAIVDRHGLPLSVNTHAAKRRLDAVGELYPTNAITIEPRLVVMNGTARKTKRLLEKHGVEVILVEYDEVHKCGGGIRCNTMQLIRDRGPMSFA
jgi:arginine deiminase